MNRIVVFSLMVLTLAYPLAAGNLSFSFVQTGTDSLFQTRERIPDRISRLSLSWNARLSALSFFAEGGYTYFQKNSGLSSFALTGGADYLLSLGEKAAFYFSIDGGTDAYGSDFRDFNSTEARVTAAAKTYVSESSIFKIDSITGYRKYRSSIFDFVSQALRLSLDKYFPSQTAIKAGLDWGYKYFLHPAASPTAVLTSNGSLQEGGRGSGFRYGRETVADSSASSIPRGQGIQIASVSVLLSQGLGSRLGLRVAGTRQWFLSERIPSIRSRNSRRSRIRPMIFSPGKDTGSMARRPSNSPGRSRPDWDILFP